MSSSISRRRREIVVCLQCRDAKIGCDKLRPSCTSCVKKNRDCWYVGETSNNRARGTRTRFLRSISQNSGISQRYPNAVSERTKGNISWVTCQRGGDRTRTSLDCETRVARELSFVGQWFGTSELCLLNTYVSESSHFMRSLLPFVKQATSCIPLHDSRTSAASINPRQAASHATAWAAICVGAVLRRNENAGVYLSNGIQAARLCYDEPCLETLTAMIAVTYAAFLMERSDTLCLFAGYVEILCAELPPHRVVDIQVSYIRWLLYISSSGTKTLRIREDHEVDRAALTPAQALSFVSFESVPKSMLMGQLPLPLPVEQATVAKEEIGKLEQALALATEHRASGIHVEIHLALSMLFLFYLRTGETEKLYQVATEVVELSCMHPLRLRTRHWYTVAVGVSRHLLRCGDIEGGKRMQDYLNKYRPLSVDMLRP